MRIFLRFRHGANVTKGKPRVNLPKCAVESAELNSLYRPAPCAKICCRKIAVLRDTRTRIFDVELGAGRLARALCVCYKSKTGRRLTTRAFHQLSCARN